jgi:hypothetical protein
MKKFWAAAILLIAAGAMVVFFASKKFANPPDSNQPGNPSAAESNSQTAIIGPSASTFAPAENLAVKAGEMAPPPPMATNVPPEIILQNARRAIVQYAQVYGGNPVGTNPEITASLMGENPRHINFITPDSGLVVNDKGEMLDGYGTPLFFHQISGHDTEIRSAGMDRKMWTFDDLVLK